MPCCLIFSQACRHFLADKAYDAQERVLDLLKKAGVQGVIPPKKNRKEPRAYDEELYKARHLIENFFAKLETIPRHRHQIR